MAEARLTLAHKAHALEILRNTHQSAVRDLQETALEELLPTLQSELALDSEWLEWAETYVDDEGTIFRLYRKNGFSKSSALTALRNALLPPLPPPAPHVSHPSIALSFASPDPPTLHVSIAYLSPSTLSSFKHTLLASYEKLRLHLIEESQSGFYCVLDLGGSARVRDILSDLIPWYTNNIQSRYPSMCAAVFIINYTWTYGGLWSVFRRIAPARALSRIFFLTPTDLSTYFPACAPPPEPPSPGYSDQDLSNLNWNAEPHSPVRTVSFSALDDRAPERTRWGLVITLLRMFGQRMRSRAWWTRWRWLGWVLLLLAVRWLFSRRRRRPNTL